jgi:hypothetical protein
VISLSIVLGKDRAARYAITERHDATPAQKQLLKDYEAGIPFGK